MKKILLLLVALTFSLTATAQLETYVTETGGENNPVVYINSNFQYDPCIFIGPSNAFENGKSCTQNLGREVANDFVLRPSEEITLTAINANIFIGATGSGVNAAFVDYTIYEDDGGMPGNFITGEFSFIPTSQTLVGTNFGFDVWNVELDITDVELSGGAGAPVTYWIGLSVEATDGSNVFWENTSAEINGAGEAYDDGTGVWIIDPDLDGVYTFTGDCRAFGVVENFADQVQIYPNPITDGTLNITTPFESEKQVIIYDVLGKRVIDAQMEGDQLNVSSLQSGVYMLQITQDGATATKKIVVQ